MRAIELCLLALGRQCNQSGNRELACRVPSAYIGPIPAPYSVFLPRCAHDMDDFFDLPTLIAIGVAIFVLFRLRSVLGTRTGTERPPVERRRPEAAAERAPGADDTVVPLRRTAEAAPANIDAERQARKVAAEIEQYSHGDQGVAAGLKAIADADPGFTPKSFLDGAKQAYEMIVTSFASGDRKTLRMLLEKDVYDGFEAEIDAREKAGRKVDFTFVGLPRIEITEAELDKKNALVTIRFNAEVVQAVRDKDGTLARGQCRPGPAAGRRMDLCPSAALARSQLEAGCDQPAELTGACSGTTRAAPHGARPAPVDRGQENRNPAPGRAARA